jgi:hypothetical protein
VTGLDACPTMVQLAATDEPRQRRNPASHLLVRQLPGSRPGQLAQHRWRRIPTFLHIRAVKFA